jgi:hypothetical protein
MFTLSSKKDYLELKNSTNLEIDTDNVYFDGTHNCYLAVDDSGQEWLIPDLFVNSLL